MLPKYKWHLATISMNKECEHVYLFRAPPISRSGDDAFNQCFADNLALTTKKSVFLEDLWSDEIQAFCLKHNLHFRGKDTLIKYGPTFWGCLRSYLSIEKNACVIVRGEFWPLDKGALFERRLVESGRKYVFNLIDNWFESKSKDQRTRAQVRCELAHVIVVPTEKLEQLVSRRFLDKKVVRIEEPINNERFQGDNICKSEAPSVIWCGNPANIDEVQSISNVLSQVYAKTRFSLTVLTGNTKPHIKLDIPWEWVPFSSANELKYTSRAWVGFSFLKKNAYSVSKGSYKLKTYMAAGTYCLASDLGHAQTIITGQEYGMRLDPSDTRAWESAFLSALGSRDKAIQAGQAAKKTAQQRFGYAEAAKVWSKIL